jgi:hypothetical protein
MNPDPTESDSPEPPHPDLAALLACWHGENALDAGGASRWLEKLRADAWLRRQFADEIQFAGLTRTVQAGEPRWLRIEERLGERAFVDPDGIDALEDLVMRGLAGARPSPRVLRVSKTPAWLSAAAGLVLGMFFTSVVFAYVVPAMERQWSVLETDFETLASPDPIGVPRSTGKWAGDFAEITGTQYEVTPRSGGKMWRFLRADNEGGTKSPVSYVGEAIHVIDLKSLRSAGIPAGSQIEISAWFAQGRVDAAARYHWNIKAAAFEGDVAEAPERWARWNVSSTILAQREVAAEGRGGWQRVGVTMLFPDNADYLVFECAVVQRQPVITAGVAAFPAHYVDDVRVRVIPPVREVNESE